MAYRMRFWDGTQWVTANANDADTVDGKHAADFAASVHTHDELKDYNSYKSGKDTNGVFTVVDYKRPADATLYMKSTLSSPDTAGNYLVSTWDYYDAAGTTIVKTVTWDITYDADNDITGIVKR